MSNPQTGTIIPDQLPPSREEKRGHFYFHNVDVAAQPAAKSNAAPPTTGISAPDAGLDPLSSTGDMSASANRKLHFDADDDREKAFSTLADTIERRRSVYTTVEKAKKDRECVEKQKSQAERMKRREELRSSIEVEKIDSRRKMSIFGTDLASRARESVTSKPTTTPTDDDAEKEVPQENGSRAVQKSSTPTKSLNATGSRSRLMKVSESPANPRFQEKQKLRENPSYGHLQTMMKNDEHLRPNIGFEGFSDVLESVQNPVSPQQSTNIPSEEVVVEEVNGVEPEEEEEVHPTVAAINPVKTIMENTDVNISSTLFPKREMERQRGRSYSHSSVGSNRESPRQSPRVASESLRTETASSGDGTPRSRRGSGRGNLTKQNTPSPQDIQRKFFGSTSPASPVNEPQSSLGLNVEDVSRDIAATEFSYGPSFSPKSGSPHKEGEEKQLFPSATSLVAPKSRRMSSATLIDSTAVSGDMENTDGGEREREREREGVSVSVGGRISGTSVRRSDELRRSLYNETSDRSRFASSPQGVHSDSEVSALAARNAELAASGEGPSSPPNTPVEARNVRLSTRTRTPSLYRRSS